MDNTATVDASNEPGDAKEDNTSSDSVTVNCPDVAIVKSAASNGVRTGETIEFVMDITNHGAGTAYDVVVTDTLPAGLAWTVTGDVENCAITDGVLTCEIPVLESGASATVTVSARAASGVCGIVTNTASVSAGNEPDAATGDNTSSASMSVSCPVKPAPDTSTPATPPVVSKLPETGDGAMAGTAPTSALFLLGSALLAGAAWLTRDRKAA